MKSPTLLNTVPSNICSHLSIFMPKYWDHVTIITILMNSVDFITTNEIWNKLIFLSWYLLHTHSVLTHKAWRHWLLLYPPAAQPQTTRQDAQQVVKLGWRCRSYFCGEEWVGPKIHQGQGVLTWNRNIFISTYEDNASTCNFRCNWRW